MSSVSEVELVTQLARLEREERYVSALRRKIHDRIASFPTPENERAERELSQQRRDLHRRIDAVQAEIEAIRADPIEAGEAVFWREGEEHELKTTGGLTALIIEGRDLDRFRGSG